MVFPVVSYAILGDMSRFVSKEFHTVKDEGKRKRGRQRTRWIDGVKEETNISVKRFLKEDNGEWKIHGVTKNRKALNIYRCGS